MLFHWQSTLAINAHRAGEEGGGGGGGGGGVSGVTLPGPQGIIDDFGENPRVT